MTDLAANEGSAFRRLLLRRSLPFALLVALAAWARLTEGIYLTGLLGVAVALLTLLTVSFGVREYLDPYFCSLGEGVMVLHYYGGRTRSVPLDELECVEMAGNGLFPRDYSQYFVLTVRDQSRIFIPPYLLGDSTRVRLEELTGSTG